MVIPRSRARLWRRLAFLAAIVAVWLLARGPIVGGPRDGQHDWTGAWWMTAFLLVLAGLWEWFGRDKEPPAP